MTDPIAEALILAIEYIATHPQGDTLDDDCRQLEIAAYLVEQATQAEKETLVRIAEKLGLPEWPKQMRVIDDEEDE
jgi:hypothetical protein